MARWRWLVVGVVGWAGGGPAVLCATRGQADMRGLGPQDRGFVVGFRCLETGVAGPGVGRVAHSRCRGENDGLNWPHCDGLNWPHLRPIVA